MLYLLTGASQGIGLGYCEELLKTSSDDTHVIAAVRNPSNATELKQLADQYKGRLDIVQMDVTKPESVKVSSYLTAYCARRILLTNRTHRALSKRSARWR